MMDNHQPRAHRENAFWPLFAIAAALILIQLIYHLGEYAGQITYYLTH